MASAAFFWLRISFLFFQSLEDRSVFLHRGHDIGGYVPVLEQAPSSEAACCALPQSFEQILPWVIDFAWSQIMDVNRSHAILEHLVVRGEAFPFEIRGIAIPAYDDARMIRDIHDGLHIRDLLRA